MKFTHNDFAKALGITADEQAVLDAGSNHKFGCRCRLCLSWWVLMGPQDPDGAREDYGPFTAAEIHAAKKAAETEANK